MHGRWSNRRGGHPPSDFTFDVLDAVIDLNFRLALGVTCLLDGRTWFDANPGSDWSMCNRIRVSLSSHSNFLKTNQRSVVAIWVINHPWLKFFFTMLVCYILVYSQRTKTGRGDRATAFVWSWGLNSVLAPWLIYMRSCFHNIMRNIR